MRSSLARITTAALVSGLALFGAAGTASAHMEHPHGAFAVGGDAYATEGGALAVGGDAEAIVEHALAVGGDAFSEEGPALAVGGDADGAGLGLAVGGDSSS
ncbi:hypothetical protein KNE206_62310 [Kitasatospora sp. NE20-6]|uniref:hypothetical protein n=1 Tax=Kitasatospora sp. NE20-6 TaxID=2859066 RepID=UPI0034DC1F1A